MDAKEAQKVLDEIQGVRPEMLTFEGTRLFEAIMQIADERDKYKKYYEKEKQENLENKRYINGLTIATGIALGGRTVEVSKKTLYELENTMKIEQVFIPETNSYRFKAI